MSVTWALLAGAVVSFPRPWPRGGAHRGSRRDSPVGWSTSTLRLTASLAAAAIAFALLGGFRGVVIGGLSAATAWWVVALPPRRRSGLVDIDQVREVPPVLDLVATALRTGLPVDVALSAGAQAAPPRLRQELFHVSGLLRLGSSPELAWASFAADPHVRAIAVVAVRSADSGIRLAEGWSATARQLRADAVTAATSRAARVGTWSMAPLGLCFLPAFVCLGIAPVVIGLASGLLGHGLL